MNIDPLSSSGGPINGAHGSTHRNAEPNIQHGSRPDSLSIERSMRIGLAMGTIPEIRPEVVERGRQLLNDPNYPGPEISHKIASLIVPFDESD